MSDRKEIHILGGGTVYHIRNHLALTAPAYGNTARDIFDILMFKELSSSEWTVKEHLTKIASSGISTLETNQDVSDLIDKLIANKNVKIIFFNVELIDYEEILKTSECDRTVRLTPAAKLIGKMRKERKDIFLVGFKTTCGSSEDDQFLTGLNLLKSASCNIVLANDTKTSLNMIITPEQARYCVTTDRCDVLKELVDITLEQCNKIYR
jgi:hypothetical protein